MISPRSCPLGQLMSFYVFVLSHLVISDVSCFGVQMEDTILIILLSSSLGGLYEIGAI